MSAGRTAKIPPGRLYDAPMGDPATAALVERMREQLDDIALRAVERYRGEIADYAASNQTLIAGEVLGTTRRSFELLLDTLEDGGPPRADVLDEIRFSLARRVNQGVSLTAIQHACRIGGEGFWEALPDGASLDAPAEREAALRAAGAVMRHTSLIAEAGAAAYLEAADDVQGDRQIVRRHLLEAVLAGRSAASPTVRDARALGIDLHADYVVIVARALAAEDSDSDPPAGTRTLRRAAAILREALTSDSGAPLAGLREGELVCLVPAASAADMDRVKQSVRSVAASLGDLGVTVGIGSWRPTPAGVPTAYSEAREAVDIALRAGIRDRVVIFEDALIDHVLRSNAHAARVVEDALGPLRASAARGNTSLVETLRTSLDTGLSVTRSAHLRSVHANTVVYRLDRIRELTGRDPRKTGDLLFLALSLRLDGELAL